MPRHIEITLLVGIFCINYIYAGPVSSGHSSSFVEEPYYGPQHQQQYGSVPAGMELINEDMKLFSTRAKCREACARGCKPITTDLDTLFFLCSQLKPPEKSIPEKLFARVSFPVLLLVGVIGVALLICLICCCKSICCHGSNRSNHSSRDPLHHKHMLDIVDHGNEFEKQPLPTSSIEEVPTPPFKMQLKSARVENV